MRVQPQSDEDMQRIVTQLRGEDQVENCEIGDGEVRVILRSGVEDYSDLPAKLFASGIRLRQFSEEELDLESAFMALTKGTSTRM